LSFISSLLIKQDLSGLLQNLNNTPTLALTVGATFCNLNHITHMAQAGLIVHSQFHSPLYVLTVLGVLHFVLNCHADTLIPAYAHNLAGLRFGFLFLHH
jgi:hypothetical protein